MPAWGNTDSVNDKPHMPLLRQVRDVVTTTVANTGTAAGVWVETQLFEFPQ